MGLTLSAWNRSIPVKEDNSLHFCITSVHVKIFATFFFLVWFFFAKLSMVLLYSNWAKNWKTKWPCHWVYLACSLEGCCYVTQQCGNTTCVTHFSTTIRWKLWAYFMSNSIATMRTIPGIWTLVERSSRLAYWAMQHSHTDSEGLGIRGIKLKMWKNIKFNLCFFRVFWGVLQQLWAKHSFINLDHTMCVKHFSTTIGWKLLAYFMHRNNAHNSWNLTLVEFALACHTKNAAFPSLKIIFCISLKKIK